jgi:hypothetical protein
MIFTVIKVSRAGKALFTGMDIKRLTAILDLLLTECTHRGILRRIARRRKDVFTLCYLIVGDEILTLR